MNFINNPPTRSLEDSEVLAVKEFLSSLSYANEDQLVLVYTAPCDAPVPLCIVPTLNMAKRMGWRHDNMLRTVYRFLAHELSHETDGAIRVRYAGSKGVAFTVPAFQQFVKWLLDTALRGHLSTQLRRMYEFKTSYGALSGLGAGLLDAAVELGMNRYHPRERPDAEVPSVWTPVCTKADITTQVKVPRDRITVSELAHRLSYSERHVRHKLAGARVELLEADANDDFLCVAPDGTVSSKTAIWCMLAMPKALNLRLAVFNELQRSQTMFKPTKVGEYDIMAPLDAVAVCEHLLQKQQAMSKAYHELTLTTQAERTKSEAELADVRAVAAAHKAKAESLQQSVANQAAKGQVIVSEYEEANPPTFSGDLRAAGYVTITDVYNKIVKELGNAKLVSLFAGTIRGNIKDAVMNTIRYTVGCKFLRADGMPCIREAWKDSALARRVYVSDASSAGHRANHGVERSTRWNVVYTPEAVRALVSSFPGLALTWIKEGCLRHMMDKEATQPEQV